MQDLELAIRERAYYLWQSAGCPEGNSDSFWLGAQRELLATTLGAVAESTAAVPHAASATVVVKSAKKAPAAKSGKGKRRAA